MSVAVTTRVLRHSPQRGAAKLLLVVLADYAGAEGLCWPGIKTLAEIINESERHTIRLLNNLETDGEIAIKPGGGRSHKTMYAILSGLSPAEQSSLKGVLQNTVIKNTVLQNTVLHGRNSDMSEPETVTSSAETVTFLNEEERPITPPQSPKTAKSQNDIRMIRESHDPDGSVSVSSVQTSTPSTPPASTSQAIELLMSTYPKLKLTEKQQASITAAVQDLKTWQAVLTLWELNGYIPKIGNMLDRYQKDCANEQQGSSAAAPRPGRLPGNVSPTSERAGYSAIGVPPPPGSPPVLKPWEIKERREKRLREHREQLEAERAAERAQAA